MSISSDSEDSYSKQKDLKETINLTLQDMMNNRIKSSALKGKDKYKREKYNSNKKNRKLKEITPTLPSLCKSKLNLIYGNCYRQSSSRIKKNLINNSSNPSRTIQAVQIGKRTPDIKPHSPLKISRFLRRFKDLNQDEPIVLYPKNKNNSNSNRSFI